MFKAKSMRDLEQVADSDPSEMWRKIKQLNNYKINKAALEILKADNSISKDLKEVLERWHKDISNLYSGVREDPDLVFDDIFFDNISRLKDEFEALSPEEQEENTNKYVTELNSDLTLLRKWSKPLVKQSSTKHLLKSQMKQ